MDKSRKNYWVLAALATALALFVVMLGAYTRLTDAGLGCPDWPGCYGQLTAPHTQTQINKAEQKYPGDMIETGKAWTEMVHRYFAGSLGLIIFVLFIWALRRRFAKDPDQPVFIPTILALLVIFQAMLGMWTVTWKLLPPVVMGHLLGGMTITALLFALSLQSSQVGRAQSHLLKAYRPWAVIGLIIVFIQIFLGGWVSSNYAAIVCTHFPFCQGSLFPPMDFSQGFNFFSPIGANYDGGNMSHPARVAVQMTHRYGAFITASYVGILSLCLLFSRKQYRLRGLGLVMLLVLFIQFCLGVLNIEWLLPLPIAVMHNGVAALLLLTQVWLVYRVFARSRQLPRIKNR